MGAQSVLVRLLMKGIPQTNVMTGNMTQLGIAVTELIVARRRFARSTHGAAAVHDYEAVREQLLTVLALRGRLPHRRRGRRGGLCRHQCARRTARRRHRRGACALGALSGRENLIHLPLQGGRLPREARRMGQYFPTPGRFAADPPPAGEGEN